MFRTGNSFCKRHLLYRSLNQFFVSCSVHFHCILNVFVLSENWFKNWLWDRCCNEKIFNGNSVIIFYNKSLHSLWKVIFLLLIDFRNCRNNITKFKHTWWKYQIRILITAFSIFSFKRWIVAIKDFDANVYVCRYLNENVKL